MNAKRTKRSFRAARRAEDEAAYPTSDVCTDRRAFLGRLGRIMAGGAAMALLVGCSSRPVDPGEGDPKPNDPYDPYDPHGHMGGVPDTMIAPVDAGPVTGDGEPEPPQPDSGPDITLGGVADTMVAPLDAGGNDH